MAGFSLANVQRDFPLITGGKIAYLDNAATTQKPVSVLEKMDSFYREYNANVHRGIHRLSERATDEYEGAREKIARFIGAKSPKEIVFTKNTTESLNLLSRTLPKLLGNRGTVLSTEMEHHSNIVPWQNSGMKFDYVPITGWGGELDLDSFALKAGKASIVTLTHASNVLGTINPVEKLGRLVPKESFLILDCAQSVPNMPVNVGKLGADFIAFSGHKMCGPTGIGVLWGKEELLENLPPFLYGGDMISSVSMKGAEWNSLPWKFEAGTPPIGEAIGLGEAVTYLKRIGMERIRTHEEKLASYCMKRLSEEIPNARVLGPLDAKKRGGLVAFSIDGVHPHDISGILDNFNIAVRAGFHCAEPVSKKLSLPGGSTRASFYLYNDPSEVDLLIDGLKKAEFLFKR